MAKSKHKKEKAKKRNVQASAPATQQQEVAGNAVAPESRTDSDPKKTGAMKPDRREIIQAPKSASPARKENGKHKETQGKGGVRLSTCIAGMFLALCLGLYLGSLAPDILKAPSHEKTEVAGRPAEQPASPENMAMKQIPAEPPKERSLPSISPGLQQHINHLEKELAQNPRNASLLAELGNAYFDTGQTRRAIEAYERSLAIEPSNPDILTDLGIMFREEKNYDKALESFRKATAIDPGHLNALFNQGVILGMDQHKHAEAKAVWEKVLQISPDARTPDGRKLADMIRQMNQSEQN